MLVTMGLAFAAYMAYGKKLLWLRIILLGIAFVRFLMILGFIKL